ncbi:MliC family protein [Phenylobacterium sp.]|uniref:MliC family protein n=1 Tax=Phenylobacterium sp. TaxID=1871053 RepID=UPI0035C7A6A1
MNTFARAAGAVVLLGAGLAGCSTVGPGVSPASFGGGTSLAPEDATDAPMTYACRDGKRFVAAYALSGEHAVVSAGGRSYRLPHVPSASGARFAGGGVDLFTKGVEATLDGAAGAPYRACRTG